MGRVNYVHKDVDLETLTEFPNNPRNHSEAQLGELMRSLEMFGQFRPLVIDDKGIILAGNGMFQAMQRLGWTTGKANEVTGLTEKEKKKLVLADNRIAHMGSSDYAIIDEILNEINDVEIPGFDPDFLAEMLAEADEVLEHAEAYGIIPDDRLEEAERAAGLYDGTNIPPRMLNNIPPPVTVIPPPAADTVETVTAETVTGAQVPVCASCKRPW